MIIKALRKPAQNTEETVLPHRHDNAELVLFTKGKGTAIIDGTEYVFEEGSIAVINRNALHSEVHDVCGEVIYFTVTDGDAEIMPNGVYKPNNFAVLKKLAMDMYRESRTPRYGFKTLLSAMAGEFLTLLARELVSDRYGTADISAAQSYLKDNCRSRIDMKAVAAMHGFGYESFRHSFKKFCGMSPLEYVIYNRLLCACDLLTDTQKSCTEIAMECNFSDSAQFSRIFKERFGITPTAYRRNISSRF